MDGSVLTVWPSDVVFGCARRRLRSSVTTRNNAQSVLAPLRRCVARRRGGVVRVARSPFLHSGLQVAVVVLEVDAEREGVFLALKTVRHSATRLGQANLRRRLRHTSTGGTARDRSPVCQMLTQNALRISISPSAAGTQSLRSVSRVEWRRSARRLIRMREHGL